jgi:hypothetical protein
VNLIPDVTLLVLQRRWLAVAHSDRACIEIRTVSSINFIIPILPTAGGPLSVSDSPDVVDREMLKASVTTTV